MSTDILSVMVARSECKHGYHLFLVQEEWQLLFHFVLQYPSMIQEAAKLRKKGIGIHIEVDLKKVCDKGSFLVALTVGARLKPHLCLHMVHDPMRSIISTQRAV